LFHYCLSIEHENICNFCHSNAANII
jgi:hypothetical protein